MVSAAPTEGDRLSWTLTDGAGKSPLGVLTTPEPLLRLQRTQRVWQVPELDAQHAKAFLELWPLGSFLVIGHDPSQVLMLKTGPSPGDVNAYQIHKFPGEPLGADAFLPALTEELIWSPHIGETQLDVEFLMELLDPEELRGEAGYYLTTWFGALYHIAHYQPDAGRTPQGLSSEARASLRQWHRRRTWHQQAQPTAQADLPFEEPWAIGDQ
ncbi:ras and Rab interactor-like protein [Cricetulus griseus]|uniref:Ras and Rab interactor-like protein n=1 Tax=Cricetulus griseus TaxID=10029 RepID=A0A061HVK4_CRIGR|nr:ras and Rab interactor-like protein [Cricetulus griseus]